MRRLAEQIMTHAGGVPEGTPVSAKGLRHRGNRAAVDQALLRLGERGRLIRADEACMFVTSKVGAHKGALGRTGSPGA